MIFEAATVYHVYTHANGSENLFRLDENYRYFLQRYSAYIEPVAVTYAYCLMPNHLHLMIQIRSEEKLLAFVRTKKNQPTLQGFQTLGEFSNVVSRQFSHLFNAYTQAYNKSYRRRGSLFIPNFKRKKVEGDNYFTQLIAYIHNNPVKHGFAKNLFDWPHSSIHAYLSDKPSRLDREYMGGWWGNREALLKFHREIPELEKGVLDC
jgi:putative transposase